MFHVSVLPEMMVTVQNLMIFNQGLTLTPTHLLPESKIDSVESRKGQLNKNTCPFRHVVFYSLEISSWCLNKLVEKIIHAEIRIKGCY